MNEENNIDRPNTFEIPGEIELPCTKAIPENAMVIAKKHAGVFKNSVIRFVIGGVFTVFVPVALIVAIAFKSPFGLRQTISLLGLLYVGLSIIFSAKSVLKKWKDMPEELISCSDGVIYFGDGQSCKLSDVEKVTSDKVSIFSGSGWGYVTIETKDQKKYVINFIKDHHDVANQLKTLAGLDK